MFCKTEPVCVTNRMLWQWQPVTSEPRNWDLGFVFPWATGSGEKPAIMAWGHSAALQSSWGGKKLNSKDNSISLPAMGGNHLVSGCPSPGRVFRHLQPWPTYWPQPQEMLRDSSAASEFLMGRPWKTNAYSCLKLLSFGVAGFPAVVNPASPPDSDLLSLLSSFKSCPKSHAFEEVYSNHFIHYGNLCPPFVHSPRHESCSLHT